MPTPSRLESIARLEEPTCSIAVADLLKITERTSAECLPQMTVMANLARAKHVTVQYLLQASALTGTCRHASEHKCTKSHDDPVMLNADPRALQSSYHCSQVQSPMQGCCNLWAKVRQELQPARPFHCDSQHEQLVGKAPKK